MIVYQFTFFNEYKEVTEVQFISETQLEKMMYNKPISYVLKLIKDISMGYLKIGKPLDFLGALQKVKLLSCEELDENKISINI